MRTSQARMHVAMFTLRVYSLLALAGLCLGGSPFERLEQVPRDWSFQRHALPRMYLGLGGGENDTDKYR